MDAQALEHAANHRLLGFMFHYRVAYGGTLLAIRGPEPESHQSSQAS
jgi:hypothetical protein